VLHIYYSIRNAYFDWYIALFIIIINVIVIIIQYTDPTGNMYVYEAAFIPKEFFEGKKMWTIFTSMFIHGDIIHIFMNLWFFYVVADNCEDYLGHFWFLIIYLMAGLMGSLLHGYVSLLIREFSEIPSLGASGAIYGILFPHIKLKILSRGYPRRIDTWTLIIIYFFTELIYAFTSLGLSGTAHFAYIGGFIMGALCAIFVKIVKKNRKEK